MDCIVLTKGVPDFRAGKVAFKEDNTLDRGKTPTVMNPNDLTALQAALEAKVKHGGTVHVISMGPPGYAKILQEAMQVYADKAYLLSDIKFAGADTLATAEALSAGIKKIGRVDLIIAGFKTADGETGQTGPQTAWKLGLPCVTHVISYEAFPEEGRLVATRTVYDEIEEVEAPLPSLLVTDPGFRPTYRRAEHRLRLLDLSEETRERAKEYEKHLKTWTAADVPANPADIGLPGSPTIVKKVDPIPRAPSERKARVLAGTPAEVRELARRIRTLMGVA